MSGGRAVASASLCGRVRAYAGLVKLSHSVFALPFALLSLLVATDGEPSLGLVCSIVVAVAAARTAAMAFNRYADRDLDAANPRTRDREIPSGKIRPNGALALAIAAGLVFLSVTWLLSPLCFWLAIPTLCWLLGYSYVKRFSVLCHLWLGVALGLSPIAAWVAVDGQFGPRLLAPLVLGIAVACWVAGFDILYSCQDDDFDRDHGLHSLPARLGRRAAMWVSRLLHAAAVAGFACFGLLTRLGHTYLGGVLLAAGLLVWQHRLLRPDDLSRIQAAFFTANGALAVVMFAAGCVDLYL